MACAEDEDFIQALDKMMLENLQVFIHLNGLSRCLLWHRADVCGVFASAAAKWRDGEGAPARRGHPAAAEEPAEEGRVCAAVHQ